MNFLNAALSMKPSLVNLEPEMVDLGEPFVDSQTFILSTFSRGPCTWPRTVSVEEGSEPQVHVYKV